MRHHNTFLPHIPRVRVDTQTLHRLREKRSYRENSQANLRTDRKIECKFTNLSIEARICHPRLPRHPHFSHPPARQNGMRRTDGRDRSRSNIIETSWRSESDRWSSARNRETSTGESLRSIVSFVPFPAFFREISTIEGKTNQECDKMLND
jgi:hypothetical protein